MSMNRILFQPGLPKLNLLKQFGNEVMEGGRILKTRCYLLRHNRLLIKDFPCASSYLAAFTYRCNHRFQLDTLPLRLHVSVEAFANPENINCHLEFTLF